MFHTIKLPTLIVAMLLMNSMSALAEIDLNNICKYSGNQREAIAQGLQNKFKGKHINELKTAVDTTWEIKTRIPKGFLSEKGIVENQENVQLDLLFKRCVEGKNQKTFIVYVLSSNSKITEIDSEIFYEDENFSNRNENLNWRRYYSAKHAILAISSIAHQIHGKDTLEQILTRAGFYKKECPAAESGAIYMFPFWPFESIAGKVGANAEPSGPAKIEIQYSREGTFIAAKETNLCRYQKGDLDG